MQHRPPRADWRAGPQSVVKHRIESRSLNHWIIAVLYHSNHITAQLLTPLFSYAAAEYWLGCMLKKFLPGNWELTIPLKLSWLRLSVNPLITPSTLQKGTWDIFLLTGDFEALLIRFVRRYKSNLLEGLGKQQATKVFKWSDGWIFSELQKGFNSTCLYCCLFFRKQNAYFSPGLSLEDLPLHLTCSNT